MMGRTARIHTRHRPEDHVLLIKSSHRKRRSARLADRLGPAAAEARDTAARYAGTTLEWASPRVDAARDWAEPRVGAGVTKVRDDVLPTVAETVAEAVTAAIVASEPVIEEAKTRGTAAVAALRGELEPPKRKRGKLRKLFFLAALVGAAVVGWKILMSRSQSDELSPWATPAPEPGPGPAWASTTTDDAAGAGPDEALADAAEELAAAEPGAATSPQETTETVDLQQSEAVNEAAKKASGR
jgi:hypothetical protein